jgi:hypothetical protein
MFHPERFGFTELCSKREAEAGHLKRLVSNGLRPTSVYSLPIYIRELKAELPPHLGARLIKTWDKYYFQNHRQKINFSTAGSNDVPISWNMQKVDQINDDFFRRLIRHSFNLEGDQYISQAIKFFLDDINYHARRQINYLMYCEFTDEEIARQWCKPLGLITALRLMYFDYSHWPKDRFVRYSMIKQMSFNLEIDQEDAHVFKRIFDLGELGLRSMFDISRVSKEEAATILSYLKASQVDNTLNLRFSISNHKEAYDYGRLAAEYATLSFKQEEIKQRTELLRLTSAKASKELGIGLETTLLAEDERLLSDIQLQIRDMALINPKPVFPSFVTIKNQEAPLTVET